MSQSKYVHLEECTVKRFSEKAVQVEWQDTVYWIPFSQLADGEEEKARKLFKANDAVDVTLSVTAWWAEKVGINVE